MKKILSIAVMIIACLPVWAQVTVYESGTEGYKSFRIPGLVKLPDGTLLAFAEGRVGDANDFGNIDIVVKKSKNNGKTWSPLRLVADNKDMQAGNPAPVVDLTDPAYPRGRVFLFYNTGNNHESEVRKGNGLREAWYVTSSDGGDTWDAPVNITAMVHRPKQAPYNFTEDWRCFFNTPGHAMQFTTGTFKGRIYVATNHSAGDQQPRFMEYRAGGYYSDDHGKTFRISEDVSFPGGNEAMATELGNNKLMLNVRNQQKNVKARIIAISSDGRSWDTAYYDHNLPDPVCQGSLITLGFKKGKAILAFSNAADTLNRDNLTLRISQDEGKTWTQRYPIDSTGEKNNSAYSDILAIGKREIGILYEKDKYSRIIFTTRKYKK
ncbi:sialidase family protein [Chitinophaga barathri]|uniref:exo-alpha-sialidase n=1 Tax=Chitinophaga barathri TaxID=1647451 RepID=A0A3N4MBG8_9BACT|nr:sialidase family protein [Chitinophaga barathri]RPD40745.1 exo-alpha-sialidase [Chitinophaga barathri]